MECLPPETVTHRPISESNRQFAPRGPVVRWRSCPVSVELTVLQEIRVASPCEASWEQMQGDERSRFCDHCQLHVYNLSAMSAPDAAALVQEKEGRLCVRY